MRDCARYLAMIFVQLAYGGSNLLMKVALVKGLNQFVFMVYRHLIAFCILAPIAFVLERKQRPPLSVSTMIKAFFLASLGTNVHLNLYYAGLGYTSATVVSALSNVIPSFAFVLTVIVGKEKVKIRRIRSQAKVIGTMICIGGSLVFTFWKGSYVWRGLVRKPLIDIYGNRASAAHTTHHRDDWVKGSTLILAADISWSTWIVLQEYLKEEPTQECKDLIASLPSRRGWINRELHLYQGFWYPTLTMEAVISFQKHFRARDSDVLLASSVKTGTTWMKALIFALTNRRRFANSEEHPLLVNNPHALVLNMEFDVYGGKKSVDLSDLESPRLFATHLPFVSLPASVKESDCKIVYIGRNPKDTLISLWHFTNKLRHESMEKIPLEVAFERFSKGESSFGPIWEHLLGYWNESLAKPQKILFLKFEEMKERPEFYISRLADFLGFSFPGEEDRQCVVDEIMKLCSFENLSQVEVNKVGKSRKGLEYNAYYRKGGVGDWTNYLTPAMADQIDDITEQKLSGSGLKI